MRTKPLAPIAILFVALLVAMLPRGATGAYVAGNAEPGHTAARSALHFAPAGASVSVPAIVAERLALPARVVVRAPAPATIQRMERVLHAMLPCGEALADEVIVLEQPARAPVTGDEPVRSGFLTGVSAVEKRDDARPYSRANLVVRLYLFLPPELLDGTGLDEALRSPNVIPYAAAPVPATYGEFLEWTLAHEAWHLIDIRARLAHVPAQAAGEVPPLDTLLNDPTRWAESFSWAGLSAHLGMTDGGNAYAGSDEMDRAYALARGATRYEHQHGAFTVRFDDGAYAFERGFMRSGYLPAEVEHLSDLAPLIQSGRMPTLYALFNSDDERFAEFGAWWWFAGAQGAADGYAQLHPSLDALYAEALHAAAGQCAAPAAVVAD